MQQLGNNVELVGSVIEQVSKILWIWPRKERFRQRWYILSYGGMVKFGLKKTKVSGLNQHF